MIEMEIKMTGADEYLEETEKIVAGIERIREALENANKAKKEFDALFGKEADDGRRESDWHA